MPKGYSQTPDGTQTYELVQLLRLSGARVTRTAMGHYNLCMGKGSWRTKTLTHCELKKRFGPGTTAYEVLLALPGADKIVKAKPRNQPVTSKHMDLA